MLVEVIYSLRKSKVRERWQKMAAILREAAAERGKFVNLSAGGRKWRRVASPRPPEVLFKPFYIFTGIMSAGAAR